MPAPRHGVLALCTGAYFATRIEPVIISPLVPDLLVAFQASKAEIGIALTGMWAAYALVQLPSGVLADRFGPRRLIVLALGLAALGSVALAGAPTLLIFALIVIVLGAGVGLYYNVGVLLVASKYEYRGRAIGIHRLGSQLAGLSAPPVAVFLALQYGWRTALLLGAAVSVPVGIGIWFGLQPGQTWKNGRSSRPGFQLQSAATFLRRPGFLLPTGVASIGEFVAVAHMSFLPVFLVETATLPQTAAGLLFSGYFAVEAISQPTAGWLADVLSPRIVLGLTMLAGMTGIALLLEGPSLTVIALGVALSGVSMGYNAPVQSSMLGLLSDTAQGTGFGLFRFVYVLLGSLGGVVTGLVVDGWGWTMAYGLLGGGFGTALVLLFVWALIDPRRDLKATT